LPNGNPGQDYRYDSSNKSDCIHNQSSDANAKGNQRRPLNLPRIAQRCSPPSG
jgi:hypothetical protein